MFTAQTVQKSWSVFKDIFLSVVNKIAPVKEVGLKHRSEPWMDFEIHGLIKCRDLYLYRFKNTGNKEFYKLYCSLRNKI